MATITVKSSGGDYTTLAAAVTNANAGDVIEVYITSEDLGTGQIEVNDTLTIRGVDTGKHTGAPTSGFVINSDGNQVIEWAGGNGETLTLENFIIHQTSSDNSHEAIRANPNADGSTIVLKNMTLRGPNSGLATDGDAIYMAVSFSITINSENSIYVGWGRSVFGCGSNNANNFSVTSNSDTFYDIGIAGDNRSGVIGVDDSDVITTADFFNSLMHMAASFNASNQVFAINGNASDSVDVDRCITNESDIDNTDTKTDCLFSRTWTDSDSPGAGDWVVVENITTRPYDLRLKDNAENDAQDAHSDASGAGLTMPSADIAGTTRPQNTDYDIGAFEIESSGTTDDLTANDVESDSEVDTPTIGQTHALTPSDVSSNSEVSSPTLGESNVLSADDVESASEVTSPAIGQGHALTPEDVESTSEVDSPTIGQTHSLTASDVESASEVSSPALGTEGTDALAPNDVQSASEVDSPTLGQKHDLTAADLVSLSEVSAPALVEVGPGQDNLTPNDIESASQVDAPALGQIHALVALDIESESQVDSPALVDLGSVTLEQVYAKVLEIHQILGLEQGSPLTVTPNSRTAADIEQEITGDGVTSTTVTRV